MRLTAFQISMQRPISRHNAQHSLQAKKGNLWLKPSSVKHIYQNSTFEKSLLVTTKLLIRGKMEGGGGLLIKVLDDWAIRIDSSNVFNLHREAGHQDFPSWWCYSKANSHYFLTQSRHSVAPMNEGNGILEEPTEHQYKADNCIDLQWWTMAEKCSPPQRISPSSMQLPRVQL